MSFYDKAYTEHKKLHMNLSPYAWDTIHNDMFTFGNERLSGFLNRIFHHYHPWADASISLAINKYIAELNNTLTTIQGHEETKQKIINKLIDQKKEELIKKTQSYNKGCSFKFWLNNENSEYLSAEYSECKEDLFYNTRSQYIKSVIEEYTRLPYIERELVYFQESIDLIQSAIDMKRQLHVETDTGNAYSVYPYQILCDSLSTTNYLTGYSQPYDSLEKKKHPCSFKISALNRIRVERSKSAFLKNVEKQFLEQIIKTHGVQFMVENTVEEVKVKLTNIGVYKYQRLTHLRPLLIDKQEDDVFVFKCTSAQAEFYFFKFGADAEIISPIELRDKFRSMYQSALTTYQQN